MNNFITVTGMPCKIFNNKVYPIYQKILGELCVMDVNNSIYYPIYYPTISILCKLKNLKNNNTDIKHISKWFSQKYTKNLDKGIELLFTTNHIV